MLIYGCKTLMVRCYSCYKLIEYDFNIFNFMSSGKIEYKCRCGIDTILMEKTINNKANVYVGCSKCGCKHEYSLNIKDLLDENKMITCPYGTSIFFLGSRENANRLLLEDQKKSGERYGYNNDKEKDIINIKVMAESLSKLQELYKKQKINCECGNSNLDMEVFFDRIELICRKCNSVKIIFTETEEDLDVLLGKNRIVLKEQSISCIDSINDTNRDMHE